MTPEERRIILTAFACSVLQILEDDEDWNADTINLIGMNAINMGLATTNPHGLFKTVPATAATSGVGG